MLASTLVMSPTRKRAFARSSRASCSVRPDKSGTVAGGWPRPGRGWLADGSGATTAIGIASANPTGVPTATGLPGVRSCLSTVPGLMLASTLVMSPTRKRAFARSSRASCSVRPDRSGTVAGGWPRPGRDWLADRSGTTTAVGIASAKPTGVPTATVLPGLRSCLSTVPGLLLASTLVMSPTRRRAFARSSRASCSVRPDRSGTVAGGWPRLGTCWFADCCHPNTGLSASIPLARNVDAIATLQKPCSRRRVMVSSVKRDCANPTPFTKRWTFLLRTGTAPTPRLTLPPSARS